MTLLTLVLVFGCPDLKVGAFSWYKREGDFATVGCEGQDVTWNLRCEGSQWTGVVGNCTKNSEYQTVMVHLKYFANAHLLHNVFMFVICSWCLCSTAIKMDPWKFK